MATTTTTFSKVAAPGGMKLFWSLAQALITGSVLIFAIFTSFFTVPADSVGVLQRFGAFTRSAEPGFHLRLPFWIDAVTIVPVRRQLKLEFGFGSGGVTNPHQASHESVKEQDMLTGDLNSALVEWVVQYRIDDPKQYVFGIRDPEDTLRAVAEAVMREVVGDRTIDEVITFGRQNIEISATPLLQEAARRYRLGLKVDLIQLKNVNPPHPVQDAFNDVNKAQQEKQRSLNLATGEYNQIIPKARGLAERSISEAQGYATKRINEAKGDSDYFNSLLGEYVKAPEITRQRLYLETMAEVLPKMGPKVILDGNASQALPYLVPLTKPKETR